MFHVRFLHKKRTTGGCDADAVRLNSAFASRDDEPAATKVRPVSPKRETGACDWETDACDWKPDNCEDGTV
jgi:hypothetical protein